MKLANKLRLTAGGILLVGIAACGNDGSPLNVGSASSDGSINPAEAGVLTGNTTDAGEPDNVSNLALATSETDEPFDLPD